MISSNTKELYCPHCGNTKKWPFCCGQDMELDKEYFQFFCNICGKELSQPKCCGEYMQPRAINT